MSRVLTNEQNYYDIADTIRQMKEVNTTYKPREMASALKDIYSNEVEGTLPLSFEANGNNLLNYRIDGAIGGVGDKTKNLFDGQFESGSGISSGNNRCRAKNPIQVEAGKKYTLSHTITNDFDFVINSSTNKTYPFDSNTITICGNSITWKSDNITFSCTNNGYISIVVRKQDNSNIYPDEIDTSLQIMFEESSTATDYEPYGYKVPVVVNGKNLFDETQVPDKSASTEASNYQIFKQNGKLIVNGITTSSQVDTEISKENGVNNQALDFINNNAGNYIFTSSVPGRIMIRYKLLGSDVVRYTFNEYNSSNRVADRIVFRLQQNYQYNNEQMNIMFKLNQIQSTNYEPYHEPTTTTIYLDEPIEENESISLSDTNTNIPTIDGTNVLTINTTVQPSNVYIQAPKDSLEAIQIANRLEEI